MRFAAALTIVVALAPGIVLGATPAPHASSAMSHHVQPSLRNPGARTGQPTMNGQGCISGHNANASQTAVNPITGKAQAKPIIEIPLGKGAGSVASATNRAQQHQACAHAR
jgi:hypothetical protein